jgi:hypothetical protein
MALPRQLLGLPFRQQHRCLNRREDEPPFAIPAIKNAPGPGLHLTCATLPRCAFLISVR